MRQIYDILVEILKELKIIESIVLKKRQAYAQRGECDYALAKYNFCPNCGADMRGTDNG